VFSEPTLIKLLSVMKRHSSARAHNLSAFANSPIHQYPRHKSDSPSPSLLKGGGDEKAAQYVGLALASILSLLSGPGRSKPEAYEN